MFVQKFNRAQEHLNALRQTIEWWSQTQPYVVEVEVNPQSGLKEVSIVAQEQPPVRLGLMAGDAIQNLRACLDHAVCETARVNSGGYLMPSVERDLMFPITTTRGAFDRTRRYQGRLGCVPPRVQAHVRRLQPYRRKDDPFRHMLWLLHELSNIDKHRRLPLMQFAVTEMFVDELVVESAEQFTIGGGGPFKHKAVLATYDADAKVKMNFQSVHIEVAFGEGTPVFGEPVLASLNTVSEWIRIAVVRPLSDYLRDPEGGIHAPAFRIQRRPPRANPSFSLGEGRPRLQ